MWDVRASTVSVSPAEIKALGRAEAEWKDLLADTLTLVVVDRPMIRYSLDFYARMVAPLGRRLEVYRTAQEAADRIGVETLPVLPPETRLPV